LVARLLERGHSDVVGLEAGRGEWFCALAWAGVLGEQGRQADALALLDPYLATGWWTATRAAAELLERWGRVEEAIVLTRVRMEAGHPMALESYARLLARHDRSDEAFSLLQPHIDDWSLATALVDVSADAGRDEEAAALLAARIRADHQCSDFPFCCRGLDPDTAVGLLATIRERQGRIEEAIALLRTRRTTLLNNRDQLADLLARQDRIEELQAYAAADDLEHAAQRLAELLEERGDVLGAIEVYRQIGEPLAHRPHSAVLLAHLLARHGRGEEAIDVVRELADSRSGDDWVLHTLADLCLDQGRPEDGLAHLDALAARRGGVEEWDLFWMRLPLMAACGRTDEALDQVRAHPEGAAAYASPHIADLLASTGRTEEAVAVLEQHRPANRHTLARHFIDLGRIEDALDVLRRTEPRSRVEPWTGARQDEPPF
jgi:tetratricopeptide (TPR) repeat protein